MNEPQRLFDCLQSQLLNFPLEDMLAGKENGTWRKYSTAEVVDIVNQLGAGLLSSGINYDDRSPEGRNKISIISKNRPEWLMVDLAVQQIGAILTPIYPTISINELEYVLWEAEVKIIFLNDAALHEKIQSIKSRVPHLKEIYSFDRIDGVKHWSQLLNNDQVLLEQVKSISDSITNDDVATIIYTSGTTGKPKGVMLSHNNIVSNVLASMPCFPPDKKMRALSFLPLNHILERMVSYLYIYTGTSIYYAENLDAIGENIKEIQPNIFTTVPLLLSRVYDKIMAKGNELKGIKRKLFFWAHNLATKYEINKNLGLAYRIQLSIANKIVFKKWREALGNELKGIVSGGSACQVRLIRIFTAAQIPILEGYGLTETSPVIAVNEWDIKGRKFGTVGPVIENVQVKIADDGEILCKGPNIMIGYYKHPGLTAEAMENGWFKTGDIGILVDNKFLKITDRKKEMFKTSGGKYVAPLPIESKLKESTYIENAMVIGAEQKYTGALIVPSYLNLKEWCRENDIEFGSPEQVIKNEKVIGLYKELVESFNKFFNHVEQIKNFELLPHDWSVDTGELTPKMSLKRKVIMEKYRDAVERIYA
ncbi:MAG TPA: long-chain fatty acid--CoA ligase [Chitinophagaceae bacterium]|nr:long-chain fatty acid--CoA ligase [Chitinophagaceae bacterium]